MMTYFMLSTMLEYRTSIGNYGDNEFESLKWTARLSMNKLGIPYVKTFKYFFNVLRLR